MKDEFMQIINFVDQDSNNSGFVSVRKTKNLVGLGISLEHNGDIEVFVDLAIARSLVNAIEKALK
jgi:hypothetical protein